MTSELGGKAPIIVFGAYPSCRELRRLMRTAGDTDIARAVAGVCFASFIASGQTCVAGTRIIVEESILANFLTALEANVASITARIGDPMNPQSTMGPLITENQLRPSVEHSRQSRHSQRTAGRVEAAVARAQVQGCRLISGGRRLEGTSSLDGFPLSTGSFFAPTVLAWDGAGDPPDLWRDELFAPVILVRPFRTGDEDEAATMANDSSYGLGAGVWTGDAARGMRMADKIEAGICWGEPSSRFRGSSVADAESSQHASSERPELALVRDVGARASREG